MHIRDLLDVGALADEVQAGWVVADRHPTLPLTLYNYARKTQYALRWNPVTRHCRGLVVDDDGTVVARPLPKFENAHDLPAGALPDRPFRIFEKVDGVLVVVAVHDGRLLATTRGRWQSPQGQQARRWLTDRFGGGTGPFAAGTTYLFEGVGLDDDAIVDHHGRQELVALTAIDNDTGTETLPPDLDHLGFEQAAEVDVPAGTAVGDLYGWERPDAEGFVVRFDDGTRVKVKFGWYRQHQAFRQNLSPRNIWLAYWDGTLDEMVEQAPDELHADIRQVVDRIESTATAAVVVADELSDRYVAVPTAELDRTMRADAVPTPYRGLVFARRNGRAPASRPLRRLTEPRADVVPTPADLPAT